MKVSDFDYRLPKELIAQKPVRPRDHSRLLVLTQGRLIKKDYFFYQVEDFLKKGDLLVLNNSKVIPARLYGKKETGGKVEILLLRKVGATDWQALIKNFKPTLKKTKLSIGNGPKLTAYPIKKLDRETWQLRFNLAGAELEKAINKSGITPTPPYIKRLSNLKEYQTIYALSPGSVAAPTAGFHFTKRLLASLEVKGIQFEYVTLHVGLGTFQPLRIEKIENHKMYSEWAEIKPATAKRLNKAKKRGRRIIAVGTTTARTLEDFFQGNQLLSGQREISLFIYPPYRFKIINGLITNFHLPKSTLLMLVSAFAGYKLIFKAYQYAIKNRYRFYSFGDATLII